MNKDIVIGIVIGVVVFVLTCFCGCSDYPEGGYVDETIGLSDNSCLSDDADYDKTNELISITDNDSDIPTNIENDSGTSHSNDNQSFDCSYDNDDAC